MMNLVSDVASTADTLASKGSVTPEGTLYKIFKGFDPAGKGFISKSRRIARNMYATEDNFFKVQNYIAEKNKYNEAFSDLWQRDPNKFVRDYADDAAKFGISSDELFTQTGYDRFIKNKAADLVKNNIPNYDYVGDFIKSLRRAPLGNFISFPVETIRTGINTLRSGVKELSDPLTAGMGMKRILGVTTFWSNDGTRSG